MPRAMFRALHLSASLNAHALAKLRVFHEATRDLGCCEVVTRRVQIPCRA